MRPLHGVDGQDRDPTSHGSYSHTRNSEKAQVADLAFGSVDLVSAYSKRSDLLVDLDRIVQQLGQADGGTNSQSVLSTGRIGGAHSLQDRLTDADVRQIVLSFQAAHLATRSPRNTHQREKRGPVASKMARWPDVISVINCRIAAT
jgi:hypothetical protein